MAVGQNQWYHFGDVKTEGTIWLLTHGQYQERTQIEMAPALIPSNLRLGGVSPDVHKEPSARSANAPEEEVREGPDASPWTLPPQPKGDRHADPFGDLDFFADAEPKPDKRPRRRRVDA
ncbi:unnamed protein product [Effrenium voratum]|nr:unnamed protein product [Effrenium voratum]